MAAPLLTVEDLFFSADGSRILRGISFSVATGDYVSIIGPNGAGKTTLLKCLDGIYRSWHGRILLDGADLKKIPRKAAARRVSYVSQAEEAPIPFSVREFVTMGRYPYMSPFSSVSSEDRSAVDRALALTGTSALSARPMATLSGGERQKVKIAAAIAQQAKLMLLDEPATFLDPAHQAEVFGILERLNREDGAAVVAVTHDINSALLFSRRIVALKQGKVTFDGGPAQMADGSVTERIYGIPFISLAYPAGGKRLLFPRIQP